MVLSHDGGRTWHWMCEAAVGYGGLWDPDYAYTADGALFATTFSGLKVMRDGCVFASAPPGTTFVSQVEVAPGGEVFYAASDPHDGNIYRSTDGGMTFTTSTAPGRADDWWESLKFSTDEPAARVPRGISVSSHCLSGTVGAGDDCVTDADCPSIQPRRIAGATVRRRAQGAAARAQRRRRAVVHRRAQARAARCDEQVRAADRRHRRADPDIVYAKLVEQTGEMLYVSKDGALTWTKILEEPEPIAFVARKSGEIVAGTKLSGSRRSLDHGTTWTDLAGPPHIGCLTEDAAGTVWACTQNYAQAMMPGIPAVPADGFGIMKTTDLATWTGTMRFQDIADPVSCPAGTAQHDQCVEKYDDMPSVWCCLAMQIGHHESRCGLFRPARVRRRPGRSTRPVARCDRSPPPPGGGCCDAGATGSWWLALPLVVVLRRRRR